MDRLRVCRMCGKDFPVNVITKHENICPERPPTIDINDKPPKRFKKIVASKIPVAALFKYEKTALKFIKGTEHNIILEKEPENQFDKNAVKVLAVWKEGNIKKCEMIGYVPKDVAAQIAGLTDNEIIGCLQFIRLPKGITENRARVEPQIFYSIYKMANN